VLSIIVSASFFLPIKIGSFFKCWFINNHTTELLDGFSPLVRLSIIAFVGLYADIIKSCLTAVVVVTALKLPCFLSKADTLAIIKPALCRASCIAFHTFAWELLNSTVIHLPGFKTL